MPKVTWQSFFWRETKVTGTKRVERQRLRDTDWNHPVMEAEREAGTQREAGQTTWVFTISLPLAAPSEGPK